MSWLEKLLPPKMQQNDRSDRRTVPEGLWLKCPSCETVLYKTDLEQNVNVCPKCGHHHRISARARLDAFLDPEGRFEIGQEVLPHCQKSSELHTPKSSGQSPITVPKFLWESVGESYSVWRC